jgi:hypothetical protein
MNSPLRNGGNADSTPEGDEAQSGSHGANQQFSTASVPRNRIEKNLEQHILAYGNRLAKLSFCGTRGDHDRIRDTTQRVQRSRRRKKEKGGD